MSREIRLFAVVDDYSAVQIENDPTGYYALDIILNSSENVILHHDRALVESRFQNSGLDKYTHSIISVDVFVQ